MTPTFFEQTLAEKVAERVDSFYTSARSSQIKKMRLPMVVSLVLDEIMQHNRQLMDEGENV